jgi:hypothetical protein
MKNNSVRSMHGEGWRVTVKLNGMSLWNQFSYLCRVQFTSSTAAAVTATATITAAVAAVMRSSDCSLQVRRRRH